MSQYSNLVGGEGLICLHQVRQKCYNLRGQLIISFSLLPNHLQALSQKLCILPFALLCNKCLVQLCRRNCQDPDHCRWERADFRESWTEWSAFLSSCVLRSAQKWSGKADAGLFLIQVSALEVLLASCKVGQENSIEKSLPWRWVRSRGKTKYSYSMLGLNV